MDAEEEEPAEEEKSPYGQCCLDVTERIATVAILVNVLVLALQVDYPDMFGKWFWIDLALTLFFTVELSIRLFIHGYRHFFCGDDWMWNNFDFMIVSLTWIDYMSVSLVDKKAVGVLRMLRMLRILRILRVMKIKEFRRVGMYMRGLIESSKVVGWIMVLFIMVIIIFAILTTQLIGHNANMFPKEAEVDEDDEDAVTDATIKKQWGSMTRSSVTLFQFLTLDDWSNITRDVSDVLGWHWYLIFTVYVVLNAVVILALLTGVITEHMMQVHRADNEDEERQKQDKLKKILKAIYKLFKFIDADGSDSIDRAEFQRLLRFFHSDGDSDAPNEFEHFLEENQDIEEALDDIRHNLVGLDDPELFDVFDMNGDGAISWDEFRISMEELNKGLTKKQTFKLQATVRKVERSADAARAAAEKGGPLRKTMAGSVEQEISHVENQVQGVDRTMDSLEASLRTIVELLET